MLNVSLVDTFKICVVNKEDRFMSAETVSNNLAFVIGVNTLVQFLFTNIYIFNGLHSQLLKAKPLAHIKHSQYLLTVTMLYTS